jgi:endonuclease/exonuclease/phosphatase family metal-dependent hydrolase
MFRSTASLMLTTAAIVLPATELGAAPGDPVVTVATYNVCKKTCGSGVFAWKHRRQSVVRNVAAADADVVALQEAAGTVRQIARGLAPYGYRLANRATAGCGRGCTQDSFIFYRTDTVEPLAVRSRDGMATLSAVARVPWTGTFDRAWSWAFLQQRATGAPLLVASVHLPNDKTVQGERLRRASTRGILHHLAANRKARAIGGLTTVIAGDLNSFDERQPHGAQRILHRKGYRDAYTAPRRSNARVPTINLTRVHRDPFPARPYRFDNPARIDYVFTDRGTPTRYEVFLRLKHGRFDNRYRGSDHNMVVAGLRLG